MVVNVGEVAVIVIVIIMFVWCTEKGKQIRT
jgi:hypothetical protein